MGTKHRQAVLSKDGELKVNQYGQWDGYPDGQGADILEYLKTGDLEKYQANLENIPQATSEQLDAIDELKDWKEQYPYLSRDCGSKIHKMIENGHVKFVDHIDEKEAQVWCEGFYTIDFNKGVFISEYNGKTITYKLDSLPSKEEYINQFINPSKNI
jgi:hypothetical protein